MDNNHNWCEDVGKGWAPLVQAALLVLKATGCKPVQVKEKFGLLRIYYDSPGGTSSREWDVAYDVLSGLEKASEIICERCGCHDETVSTRPNDGEYWVLTLCDKCRLLTKEGDRRASER